MKDFSKEKIEFQNLNLNKVVTFLNCIEDTKSLQLNAIKKRFEETQNHFQDVLLLLLQTDILKIDSDNQLKLRSNLLGLNKEQVGAHLADAIFHPSFFRDSGLDRFVENFSSSNGQYWFLPNRELRLKSSGVRNFLISIGVLLYDSKRDGYFVPSGKAKYFKQKRQTLTPLELSRKLQEIGELGLAAEEAALDFEKNRLVEFPELGNKIRHVSKQVVNAGYDLQSFSVLSSKKIKSRYIEVKAVSISDRKFYWSTNEISTAKKLGELYFLYLVPTEGKNKFDFKNLLIIQNPFKKVFQNKKEWGRFIELTSFYQN